MKNIAIVLSGGSGKRMNSDIPKQYIQLKGKPILYYALKAFQDSFIDEIILVCISGDEDYCKDEYVNKYGITKISHIIAGGKERYHSVMNGLSCIDDDVKGNVYIHDGARPFITQDVLESIRKSLDNNKACIAGVPVKDTIKIVNENMNVETTPPREYVYQIQTPQAFSIEVAKEAYSILQNEENADNLDGIKITDDAMVVEHFLGAPVKVVMADYRNIKITTPEDVIIGESILESLK